MNFNYTILLRNASLYGSGCKKLADVNAFTAAVGVVATAPTAAQLAGLGINKKAADILEGKIVSGNSKNKDGNDYYYMIKNNKIVAIYAEN